jgi:hypothetical protein
MPRSQQHHAHKGAPHSQRIGNLVVTHIGVIPQHQRHARARPQFVQRSANFFAGSSFDQLIQLVRIGVFKRQCLQIFGLFVLANFSAPQHIPTMIRSHAIEPRRKWPAGVVLI